MIIWCGRDELMGCHTLLMHAAHARAVMKTQAMKFTEVHGSSLKLIEVRTQRTQCVGSCCVAAGGQGVR